MKRAVERIPLPSLSPGTRRELAVHHYGTPGTSICRIAGAEKLPRRKAGNLLEA